MTNYPHRISACVLLQATIPLKLHNLTDYATGSQKLARSGIERSPKAHN